MEHFYNQRMFWNWLKDTRRYWLYCIGYPLNIFRMLLYCRSRKLQTNKCTNIKIYLYSDSKCTFFFVLKTEGDKYTTIECFKTRIIRYQWIKIFINTRYQKKRITNDKNYWSIDDSLFANYYAFFFFYITRLWKNDIITTNFKSSVIVLMCIFFYLFFSNGGSTIDSITNSCIRKKIAKEKLIAHWKIIWLFIC